MQNKLDALISLKNFFVPRNNQWLKRAIVIFAFVFFDYFSTLAFCHIPHQEANLYARIFMENLGIPFGLTLFVLIANLPIYMALSFDSHLVRFPFKIAFIVESTVDVIFSWFIAGLHFGGGTSWFWDAPDLNRQVVGAILYLVIAILFVKPHKLHWENHLLISA